MTDRKSEGASSYALDPERLIAGVDLVRRTGAGSISFGWLDDVEGPLDAESLAKMRWWAEAKHGSHRSIVEEQKSPEGAVEALAAKLVTGGMCAHCKKTTALGSGKADECVFVRRGGTWVLGCADTPEGNQPKTSGQILAEDILREGGPIEMAHRAMGGYYSDFSSPHALPQLALIEDLNRVKLLALIPLVKNGKYDATKAESEAWAQSDEGRKTMSEFFGSPDARPNRESRRKAAKQRKKQKRGY